MVNFGPLAAEIVSLVCGTPVNFNGFRVLAALLHVTRNGRQPKFAALNRVCHLHLAGRPSRWAMAHILHHESKKCATLTMAITLSILGGFATFFHFCKEQ